ncbi:MAG: DNA-3-methyladenine glycosylase 2 family protein [Ktedonobacterales bacterium]|nr:DNA-3-methyladenine glycosylase 2 family protein [Ktedonobacterales bacterium]
MTREIELSPVAPYDFMAALAYLRGAHWAILERMTETAYLRALHLLGQAVLLELRSEGTPAQPRLALRVTAAAVDDALLAAAAAHIRRVFTLDVDPTPFLALAAREPIFGAVAQDAALFRPIIIASPYEALLWAIIGQQINTTFAATLKRVLVELAGHTLVIDDEGFPLLPTPAEVAQIVPAALRARQFSGQKTAYVLGVSAAIVAGTLDFAQLAALPAEDAITALMQHKGIGRWTAECVLMRGLGAVDVLPAGDVGLRAAIGRAYALGRHASETEVRERATAWAGWRGWATFYWWRSLQLARAMG